MTHIPCPYTGAAHCGKHVGPCEVCGKYGYMTVRDKIGTAIFAFMLIVVLMLLMFGCSSHYCPTYGKKDRYANMKHK